MSYVPNHAMKHAHTEAPPAEEPSVARQALDTVEHISPPMWTMIAAGVAGAVGTALILSLRSSTPAPKAPAKRGRPARKKSD